jgi:hypothetical protein
MQQTASSHPTHNNNTQNGRAALNNDIMHLHCSSIYHGRQKLLKELRAQRKTVKEFLSKAVGPPR